MSIHVCRTRYICRLAVLVLAILAGYAAQPVSQHLAMVQEPGPEPTCDCVI